MLAFKTSRPLRLIAGGALVGALSFGTAVAVLAAQVDADPGVVITQAKAAESQLRPKPAPKAAPPKPAVAAAKAVPAEAQAAPAAPSYLCLSNSCAKVAMLPMRSEADQAADAEAEMALVSSVATQIAARMLGVNFTSGLGFAGGVDGESGVLLTPVVDEDDGE